MRSSMIYHALLSKWQTFWYNFAWSDWLTYVDGWIPRLALSVPIVGYLILFNDTVSHALEFVHITSQPINEIGLTGTQRLRFIYFGLIALGVSNFIFRLKRPFAFRYGTNVKDYSKACLDLFNLYDFVQLHDTIRLEGHKTPQGNYNDSEWDGFLKAATNTGEGTDRVERDGNWDDACGRYGNLLRAILSETFFRQNIRRRLWLVTCVILSTLGYLLLAVPSIDLFVKVLRSSVAGL